MEGWRTYRTLEVIPALLVGRGKYRNSRELLWISSIFNWWEDQEARTFSTSNDTVHVEGLLGEDVETGRR